MGNLDAALQWNNSIVQDDLPEVGRRVYYHARLLKLLLHYEMGHTDLLDYLVVSTYRYFRSRNIVHGFEEAVLDFFRGVLRLKGGRLPLLELFESLRARLAALADDPLEAEAFDSFNYVDWLDHKIASLKGRSRRDGPDGASRIAA
jgi:hypothetical protein